MTDPMHLTRCPVCRAGFNGTEKDEEPCRRCGSDLRFPRQTFAWARYYRQCARRALASDEFPTALYRARQAIALVDNEQTRKTLAAALYAAGQKAEAASVLAGPDR